MPLSFDDTKYFYIKPEFGSPWPSRYDFKSTRVTIEIFCPNGNELRFFEEGEASATKISHLISVNVKKTLKEQAGKFTITLVDKIIDTAVNQNAFALKKLNPKYENKKVKYRDLIMPQSYVKIRFNGNVVMNGIVDTIGRSVTPGQTKTVVVTGRDMGGLLIDFKRWWSPYATNTPLDNQAITQGGLIQTYTSRSVQEIMSNVFYDWMGRLYGLFIGKNIPGTIFNSDDIENLSDVAKQQAWHINSPKGVMTISDVLKINSRSKYASDEQRKGPTDSGMCRDGHVYLNMTEMFYNSYNNGGDFFGIYEQLITRPLNEMWVTSGGKKSVTLSKKFKTITNRTDKDGDVIGYVIDTSSQIAGKEGIDRVDLDEDASYLIVRPAPYSTRMNAASLARLHDAKIQKTIIEAKTNDSLDAKIQEKNKKEEEKNVYDNVEPADSLLDLEDLETLIVTEDNIISKNLNRGKTSDIYTSYALQMSGFVSELQGAAFVPPLYNIDLFKLYGHNPLIVNIISLSANNTKKGEVVESTQEQDSFSSNIRALQSMIRTWYAFSDRNLSGSITISGNSLAREGMAVHYLPTLDGRIEDEDESRIYYCTGVDHNWQVGGAYTTTLDVEYGITDYEDDGRDDLLSIGKELLSAGQATVDYFKELLGL